VEEAPSGFVFFAAAAWSRRKRIATNEVEPVVTGIETTGPRCCLPACQLMKTTMGTCALLSGLAGDFPD
jgi:hypothetical protein